MERTESTYKCSVSFIRLKTGVSSAQIRPAAPLRLGTHPNRASAGECQELDLTAVSMPAALYGGLPPFHRVTYPGQVVVSR